MFLTPEQVRAIRLKGAEDYPLERIGKTLKVIPVSGSKAMEIRERQAELDPNTPRGQRELFLFLLAAACADETGDALTADDAATLLDVLSIEEVSALINRVGKSLGVQVGKAQASPASATSSSDSVSPSAGPTPTT